MNKIILPILAVIIVIAGAFLIANYPTDVRPPDKSAFEPDTGFHGDDLSKIPKDAIVVTIEKTFWDAPVEVFNPRDITIKKGETVYFVNKTKNEHWPASAIHPTHQKYPNSDIKKCGKSDASKIFDACRAIMTGNFWAFTFGSAGRWEFHDHLNVNEILTGSVTVNAPGKGLTDKEAVEIARKHGLTITIDASPRGDLLYRDESKIYLTDCDAGKRIIIDAVKGDVLGFENDDCLANIEDLGKLNVWKSPEVQELVKKHGARLMVKALDINLIEDVEYIKKIHPKFKEETGCIIVVYVHGGDPNEGFVYQEDKELNIIYKETLAEFMEKTKKSDPAVMAKFYMSLH